MWGRAIYGQLAAVVGSGLLLICVPFMPSVWGLPRGRVAEMCVFWAGSGLLLFGWEASRATFIRSYWSGLLSPAARRIGVCSAASAVLGTACCVLTLSILLITSLDGAGIIPNDDIVSNMPSALRYLATLPLVPMFVCQCLSLGTLRLPAVRHQPLPGRAARTVLLALLFLASILFAGSLLLFLVDRWFALYTVFITWFAQWLFVLLAAEQSASLTRELS